MEKYGSSYLQYRGSGWFFLAIYHMVRVGEKRCAEIIASYGEYVV